MILLYLHPLIPNKLILYLSYIFYLFEEDELAHEYFRVAESIESNNSELMKLRNILLFGDMPLFVAHDSADVWASPQRFLLDEDGKIVASGGELSRIMLILKTIMDNTIASRPAKHPLTGSDKLFDFSGLGNHYPLREPAVSPAMNSFCNRKKNASMGIAERNIRENICP